MTPSCDKRSLPNVIQQAEGTPYSHNTLRSAVPVLGPVLDGYGLITPIPGHYGRVRDKMYVPKPGW